MKGKINGNKIKGKKLTATLLIAVFILSTIAYAIPLASAVGTEYFVAITGVDGTNTGTTEATAFLTITYALTKATTTGDTITVLPGTYTESTTGAEYPLKISVEDLTLKSRDGATTTILTVTSPTEQLGLSLQADGINFEGFTVNGVTGDTIVWIQAVTSGVTVKDNVFNGGMSAIVFQEHDTDRVTLAEISGNTITSPYSIVMFGGLNNKIYDNRITGSSGDGISFWGGPSGYPAKGNEITGNTITGKNNWGIILAVAGSDNLFEDNLIADNIISGITGTGNGIMTQSGLTTTVLVITGNDIFENAGDGIELASAASWDSTNLINNNNIWGNLGYGLDVDGLTVDAELNWWGHPSVPTDGSSTPDDLHTGDDIDYTPWLIGSYPDGLKSIGNVADVGTVSGAKDTSKTPGGLLKFYWDEVHAWDAVTGTGLLATTYAKADKSFNKEITIPVSVEGSHSVLIYDDIDGNLLDPVTLFNVDAEIVLAPTAGIKGDTIDITGTGFGDEEVITIKYDSTPLDTIPAVVTTTALGSFTASFVIPDAVTADVDITAEGVTTTESATKLLKVGTVITLTPKKGLT